MHRLAVLACLLIASVCLASGSAAAKKLPEGVSLEEFTEILKRAAGSDVPAQAGIGGFVAKVRGIEVGWIEGKAEGKTAATLVGDAIDLVKIMCNESSLQLSAVTRQALDGVRLLRQSFSCRVFGPITQYNEALVVEDGDRFQIFYNGGLGEQRDTIAKVGDDIVAVLVDTYR